MAVTPMKKTRRLTAKQEAFVKTFLETKNASEAVRQSYAPTTPDTVRAIASENLAKPSIQAAIQGLKDQMVEDSSFVYALQKDILKRSAEHPKQWELTNKIANKILDRAGFMPTHKSETKSMHAKFVITRGDDSQPDTSINS